MNKKMIMVLVLAVVVVFVAFAIASVDVSNETALIIEGKELTEVLKDENDNGVLEVTVNIPVVSTDIEADDANVNLINDTFDSYYFSYMDKIKEESFDIAKDNLEYAKENAELTTEDYIFEAGNNYEIIRNDNKVLSVKMSSFVYTGGAHGSHYIEGLNFDLQNNKLIEFEDLFTVPKELYEDTLFNLINDKIKNLQAQEEVFFYDDYENNIKEAFDDNLFLLTDNGITFIYEEYEITAYAAGPQLIEVTYDEIKDIVNQEYVK